MTPSHAEAFFRASNNDIPSNEHSFIWNAENMPAGTYFAVIREGSSVQRVALSLAR